MFGIFKRKCRVSEEDLKIKSILESMERMQKRADEITKEATVLCEMINKKYEGIKLAHKEIKSILISLEPENKINIDIK